MTTSLYMPDVKVEIAFGDGYATPAASRTWTDVSAYVELEDEIDIGFGRGDELSTADANTLSLTLDNTDGRFTAGLSTGAYYPNVRIGVPIRVTATPVGGAESVRFVGFVDEWPVTWDGTDTYASATISATSRLARIGLNAELRPIIEQTYMLDSPIAHYPFSEAAHASRAVDISGHGARFLRIKGGGRQAPPAFGVSTGPGTDGLTAVATNGITYLGTSNGPAVTFGAVSIEGFLLTVDEIGSVFDLADADTLDPGLHVFLLGGALAATITDQTGTVHLVGTKADCSDAATHHFALTWNDTTDTAVFYVDGVSVGSISTAAWSGWSASSTIIRAGLELAATLAHFAVYDYVLTAGQVADHAAAGLTGFDGEVTDDRLIRYASFAGVASTEISTETGQTGCAHVDTTGGSAVELMRVVEAAEGGVLYDAPDGTLSFQNRAHRYARAADVTLDLAAQTVGSDFAPKLDRTGLLNDVTVSDTLAAVVARRVDTTSRDYYGPAATSIETLSSDDDEPDQLAAWLVATRAEPIPRIPTLTVDLLPFTTTPSQDDVLALTIGSRIDVENQPAQAPDTTATYFVEGYTETIGPESYSITFNVSPGSIWLNTAAFDDALRGFDSGVIFAY